MQEDKPVPESDSQQKKSDWRETAAQASQEADPQKLKQLVNELCDQLDRLQHSKKPNRPASSSGIDGGPRDPAYPPDGDRDRNRP